MLCGEAIVWARNERLADVACSDFVAIDRQAKRLVRLCSDMAQGGYWHALLRHELNTDCRPCCAQHSMGLPCMGMTLAHNKASCVYRACEELKYGADAGSRIMSISKKSVRRLLEKRFPHYEVVFVCDFMLEDGDVMAGSVLAYQEDGGDPDYRCHFAVTADGVLYTWAPHHLYPYALGWGWERCNLKARRPRLRAW